MNSDPVKQEKVIVVMPAYNAEQTLEKTIRDIPLHIVDEIILVDDASTDTTIETAKRLVESHPNLVEKESELVEGKVFMTIVSLSKNRGYGGNQKECYRIALEHGADIVVMLHPDYQYDPKLTKHLVEFIKDGYFDMMLGSRIRSRKEALDGGMPLYKYIANRALTLTQNIVSGRVLSEWHTGMRAYKSTVLKNIDFNSFSDDFVFDTQMLFGVVKKGYSIGDIPVPVRYFNEASSINFKRSLEYGLLTLAETIKFVVETNTQIILYFITGILAYVTNLGSYAFLIYVINMWYVEAAIISFLLGGIVSFILQKLWTFKNFSKTDALLQLSLYTILVILNSIINSLIIFSLVEVLSVHKLVANLISTLFILVWNFFIYKYIVFRPKN